MEKSLSQEKLNKFYRKELKIVGKTELEEIKDRRKSLIKAGHSIFLCHSHIDKTIVDKMLVLFNKLKIDLYIDWMDTNMPAITDKGTAEIIKEKIHSCDKFIFLATYSGLKSKWCNWELGFAYSSKSENNVAILPIESKSGKWAGNEYLQLYPEMEIDLFGKDDDLTSEDISINFYGERIIGLSQWLADIK